MKGSFRKEVGFIQTRVCPITGIMTSKFYYPEDFEKVSKKTQMDKKLEKIQKKTSNENLKESIAQKRAILSKNKTVRK